jgi:GWxTD domain-containing protein
MTMLLHWIQTPAARAVGWTLFHVLWEGIAIAVLLWVTLLWLKSARARYAAACLAMAAMLAACAGTFLTVLPQQSLVLTAPAQFPPAAPPVDGNGNLHAGRPFHAADLLPWAAPVWLAGVLLLHLRMIAAWIAADRLRRSGVCLAPPEWQVRLAMLAAGVRLSRPVVLLESCRVDVPLVVGYLRPVILLPLGLLAGMPPAHLETILLHELAHIRRHDYLVNLLQTVAENLLFYHPAVWWISRVIRTEREHCCDDVVVAMRGSALDYAVALTALEARRWTAEPVLASTGGSLMKRIHRLLDHSERPHAALTPAFSACLIVVTAAVSLMAWQPKPADAPQDRSTQAAESPFQKWLNQDVAYIISDAERAAFRQLNTDEERQHFIEQFWLRRDPTPGTPENEFKEEFYRRIAYANQHFTGAGGLSGWRTDRGRIYITFGPPDQMEDHPGDQTRPYPFQQWKYRHIEGVGDGVIVDFVDPNRSGEYRMTMDDRGNSVAAPEAKVSRASIWPDVVKRGDMRRMVRGLGVLASNVTAEIMVAETQMPEVRLGQIAHVDLRNGVVAGRVSRIAPEALNGTVKVTVQFDVPAPATVQNGQSVDATIDIEVLHDVLYVGRPVFGRANGMALIFKVDSDGATAVRVPVLFGRQSVNQMEVLSGLQAGDRVILSDMSAYSRFDRVQLQ